MRHGKFTERRAIFWSCARTLVVAAVLLAATAAAANPAFDPEPWIEDLEQARGAFATKYANLEWAVFEREIDLVALFTTTRTRIEVASSDADVKAAFERMVKRFGDGHVRIRWSDSQAPQATPHADCQALNYDARMQGMSVAALIPAYTPLAGPVARVFPAGVIRGGKRTIGVIRIGVFTPEGFPELCAEALTALQIAPTALCDEACAEHIKDWVSARMTQDLMAQLHAIKSAGADVLVADLTDNGGGTEWYEAAMRMVTAVRLRAARIDFVRGTQWATELAEKEGKLRAAAGGEQGSARVLLLNLADQAAAKRREAESPCDSTPIWDGKHASCRWLGEGFFSSGLLESGDPELLRRRPWGSLVFEPVKFPYTEGVWSGPLIVLVNQGTASAAEGFAAELQDNHAAVIMGAPTLGAGCGHTDGSAPTVLKHSGARLELPDCVRVRADGTNEVMGVQPDILVGLRLEDGPHRRALRIAEKLPLAVARAFGKKN
jgi:hypothetical protein